MRFDLVDMQLLVNIAEEQSLTKGAERSHLSLPSASTRIRLFEQNLGTKLLYRSKQGVTLTPAGKALLYHARIVLQQLENLRGDLQQYTQQIKGHVRLFANATSINASLPRLLREYLAAYPNVDVDLHERLSSDGARSVADGTADIAIIAEEAYIGDLEVLPYSSEELVLVTGRTHPLAACRQVDFADTLNFDYVGLQDSSAIHQFILKRAQELHRQMHTRIQVGSFDTICRMIEANIGIGVLPESVARGYSTILDIRVIPLRDEWSIRHSFVCIRKLESLPAFAQELVRMLTQHEKLPTADTSQGNFG